MRFAHLSALSLLAGLSCGCSFGLFQTAKTLPAKEVQLHGGLIGTENEINEGSSQSGSEAVPAKTSRVSVQGELGLRVGLGKQTELDIGMYLLPGLQVSAKHNLIDDQKPYALAVRGGLAGGGIGGSSLFSIMGGVIGSYRLASWFSVYGGSTLVNHYISRKSDEEIGLAPGESLAKRTYLGDGLLQLATGLELGKQGGVYLEYGFWLPLQNDPGDQYRFIKTHLIGLAVFSR